MGGVEGVFVAGDVGLPEVDVATRFVLGVATFYARAGDGCAVEFQGAPEFFRFGVVAEAGVGRELGGGVVAEDGLLGELVGFEEGPAMQADDGGVEM